MFFLLPNRKRSWSKAKFGNKTSTDHSPATPTRVVRKASGGGSKKLQQLLGASESDIDLLLLRPVEISPSHAHRVRRYFKMRVVFCKSWIKIVKGTSKMPIFLEEKLDFMCAHGVNRRRLRDNDSVALRRLHFIMLFVRTGG